MSQTPLRVYRLYAPNQQNLQAPSSGNLPLELADTARLTGTSEHSVSIHSAAEYSVDALNIQCGCTVNLLNIQLQSEYAALIFSAAQDIQMVNVHVLPTGTVNNHSSGHCAHAPKAVFTEP